MKTFVPIIKNTLLKFGSANRTNSSNDKLPSGNHRAKASVIHHVDIPQVFTTHYGASLIKSKSATVWKMTLRSSSFTCWIALESE